MLTYQLIRSKRRTLAIYVKVDGSVQVKAPYSVDKETIEAFVREKTDWINRAKKRLEERTKCRKIVNLTCADIVRLKEEAEVYLKSRAPYFAQRMGVAYKKVNITKAKTRWGSCSSKGNISFSYRLILNDKRAVDYVIVHELAHLKEMNHSSKFWSEVRKAMPDYEERRKLLREFQAMVEIVEAEQ